MIAISKLAAAVQPSATMAAGNKAKQMKADGIDGDSGSCGGGQCCRCPIFARRAPSHDDGGRSILCTVGQEHGG